MRAAAHVLTLTGSEESSISLKAVGAHDEGASAERWAGQPSPRPRRQACAASRRQRAGAPCALMPSRWRADADGERGARLELLIACLLDINRSQQVTQAMSEPRGRTDLLKPSFEPHAAAQPLGHSLLHGPPRAQHIVVVLGVGPGLGLDVARSQLLFI